jgi:hypothetical protein
MLAMPHGILVQHALPSWHIFVMHALPSVHGRLCVCARWRNLQAGNAFVAHISDAMHFHRCMTECVCLGGTNYRQAAPSWRLFCVHMFSLMGRPCVCPGGTIFMQARQVGIGFRSPNIPFIFMHLRTQLYCARSATLRAKY